MSSNISRELEQLKNDATHQTPVIKAQDWKKSQWHGWADRVNPDTAIEYKSPLKPAGDKKARGENAKKKPHVFSNHWDQDPRDPDYVEEEEASEDDEQAEKKKEAGRKDESDEKYEDLSQTKVGGRVKGAPKKRMTRSGGKRA